MKKFYPRVELTALRRRLEHLEFENEFILEFLRKYFITNGKANKKAIIPDVVKAHDPAIFLYNQFNGNHTRIVK